MACGKTIWYLFTILAFVNFLLAEEGSESRQQSPPGPLNSNEGRPFGQGGPGGPPNTNENGPPTPGGPGGPPNSNEDIESPTDERAGIGGFQFPTFGGSGSMGSFLFPGFGSLFGSGSSNGTQGSQFPSFGSLFGGSREGEINGELEESESTLSPTENKEVEPESRLFFSSLLFTRLVTCNYTSQAGSTCPGCRQALVCFPSNVGRLRTCTFPFSYCNGGRCSIFPGSACTTSSTNSTG